MRTTSVARQRVPRLSFVWLLSFGLVGSCAGLPVAVMAEDTLVIIPDQIVLDGPLARQRVIVNDQRVGELAGLPADEPQWLIEDDSIAAVEDGLVKPLRSGKTRLVARLGERMATAEIEVRHWVEKPSWNFRNHVLPVLSKASCNSGACHGALAGKGGFRLSLRGYDPETDHHTITAQARGRRIELADPGRSLLLAKPSGAIPHKGGLRFNVGSHEYRVLSEWIASGASGPDPNDARLESLEVLPERSRLRPGTEQQMVVRARYTDGRVEDVTHWAKFASANEAVAAVSESGRVTVVGHGEGAITAWFSSQIVIARVTVPFPNEVSEETYTAASRRNFIDDLVLEQLQRLKLPPSPDCDDATFIRRVSIDTTGRLPSAERVREFMADTRPDRRDLLIEELLQSPEFVDYWTYRWSDLLLINGDMLRPEPVKAYYQWISSHVERNTPWDQFVRQIVTATGSSVENGATNFYALHQDPEGMTENVSQAFLGLSIGCAKCHNHPLEKWTNDQYYAMANLFARVRAKGWGGDARNGDGIRTLYVANRGDLIQPLRGKPQPPAPLDGESIDFNDPRDRREHLADWLVSNENPYFARSITNRVWANYFGVGLVESVDDMRVSNPASNEELLAAASRYLVENRFDLKQLMRLILQSATYQRSSEVLAGNQAETRFYSRYYPRRMMAEVMLDAVSDVTDVPTPFTQIVYSGADKRGTDFYPLGTRAIQLYDSAVDSYFLKTFGRNQRRITCECERSDEPSMVQVLHISNGDTINGKLQADKNRITALLAGHLSDAEVVDQAYLVALSRYPTEAEKLALVEILGESAADERRAVLEDLFWSLLSSREFLFNH